MKNVPFSNGDYFDDEPLHARGADNQTACMRDVEPGAELIFASKESDVECDGCRAALRAHRPIILARGSLPIPSKFFEREQAVLERSQRQELIQYDEIT